jgi:hypothetical protein
MSPPSLLLQNGLAVHPEPFTTKVGEGALTLRIGCVRASLIIVAGYRSFGSIALDFEGREQDRKETYHIQVPESRGR